MRTFKGRRVLVAAALAIALVGAGMGVAHAVTTTKAGTTVGRVTVVTQDTAQLYSSQAWTTVASTSVLGVSGSHILVEFTAESVTFGTVGTWASIRILVNNQEADPAVGIDFAFDHVQDQASWESHSVRRVKTVPSQGINTVTVQIAHSHANTFTRLDDWTLVAWAINP